jgi:hypothetical protein
MPILAHLWRHTWVRQHVICLTHTHTHTLTVFLSLTPSLTSHTHTYVICLTHTQFFLSHTISHFTHTNTHSPQRAPRGSFQIFLWFITLQFFGTFWRFRRFWTIRRFRRFRTSTLHEKKQLASFTIWIKLTHFFFCKWSQEWNKKKKTYTPETMILLLRQTIFLKWMQMLLYMSL